MILDEDVLTWYNGLSQREQEQFLADITPQVKERLRGPLWEPLPGPQTEAFYSEADVLGYGGAGGGGKSDLLLGLAATQHQRSVIFRRVFPSLRGMIERSREIFNPDGDEHTKDRFNESLHRWHLGPGRQLEFEACQHEKDKERQRGRPRDFYGFDEVTEFTRSQVEFITAWNRSVDPDQRCRIILTFNPPATEAGMWVTQFFLPWLAYLHPEEFTHLNPAAPGELRWYTTIDGEEVECPNGDPFEHNGELLKPQSRTFIPAKLEDNPYLENTNYRAILQTLPEPLRSQMLYGDFSAAIAEDIWQVIPTGWIKAAQQRWLEREKPSIPLTSVAIDVARGGQDRTAISKRYANWFDELVVYPGKETPTGPVVAALANQEIESMPAYINIDLIGVGTSVYDSMSPKYDRVNGVNVAAGSNYLDKSKKFKMRNIRAEMYWRLREALDPVEGDDIALPPGNDIVVDLAASRYTVTTAGIGIESKEDIKKRLGHSPDLGDAIALHFATQVSAGGNWGNITKESKARAAGKRPVDWVVRRR